MCTQNTLETWFVSVNYGMQVSTTDLHAHSWPYDTVMEINSSHSCSQINNFPFKVKLYIHRIRYFKCSPWEVHYALIRPLFLALLIWLSFLQTKYQWCRSTATLTYHVDLRVRNQRWENLCITHTTWHIITITLFIPIYHDPRQQTYGCCTVI